MIWALVKGLLFFGIVAGLTYGATLLLESEGGLRLIAGGTNSPSARCRR